MDVLELARTIISFHTESPAGNEEDLARFIHDYIHDMQLDGFTAELHRFEPKRANLIVRLGPSSAEPGLLLSGHIDTVPVGELANWSHDPFGGEIEDGKMFGRGAADMKSGVAALLKSLEILKGKKLSRRLIFIATAGEENGCIGLNRIMEDRKLLAGECKWGIDAEPTEMRVVRKHRGVTRFRVSLQGKNAHASTPEMGVNAIENASKFIEEIRRYRSRLNEEIDPELGATVLPVTLFYGGVKGRYNVIPDSCEFFINCRRIPLHSADKVLADLVGISNRLSAEDTRFNAQITIEFNANTLEIPRESEFVKLAEKIVGRESIAAPYATEASIYTELGIPTVVLGPGSVEQAHIIDEFVSIKQVERAVQAYEGMTQEICL